MQSRLTLLEITCKSLDETSNLYKNTSLKWLNSEYFTSYAIAHHS